MARKKSEDKRIGILEAAAKAVAENGISATTAQIAKAAGVAEGSLFTYFDTKDALFNELYMMLKTDLLTVFNANYPAQSGVRERARYIWDANLNWGISQPAKRKAMLQLSVSERITSENKKRGTDMFAAISDMMREGTTNRALAALPLSFTGALLTALSDTTIDFVLANPEEREKYSTAGFEAFWNAIRQA
jgi:AcrR family transcriptional regulator